MRLRKQKEGWKKKIANGDKKVLSYKRQGIRSRHGFAH